MLGGKGKGGRVGQRESPSGTEVSPCLRVANLQKMFFSYGVVLVGWPWHGRRRRIAFAAISAIQGSEIHNT
jgi:hypothetical protein